MEAVIRVIIEDAKGELRHIDPNDNYTIQCAYQHNFTIPKHNIYLHSEWCPKCTYTPDKVPVFDRAVAVCANLLLNGHCEEVAGNVTYTTAASGSKYRIMAEDVAVGLKVDKKIQNILISRNTFSSTLANFKQALYKRLSEYGLVTTNDAVTTAFLSDANEHMLISTIWNTARFYAQTKSVPQISIKSKAVEMSAIDKRMQELIGGLTTTPYTAVEQGGQNPHRLIIEQGGMGGALSSHHGEVVKHLNRIAQTLSSHIAEMDASAVYNIKNALDQLVVTVNQRISELGEATVVMPMFGDDTKSTYTAKMAVPSAIFSIVDEKVDASNSETFEVVDEVRSLGDSGINISSTDTSTSDVPATDIPAIDTAAAIDTATVDATAAIDIAVEPPSDRSEVQSSVSEEKNSSDPLMGSIDMSELDRLLNGFV